LDLSRRGEGRKHKNRPARVTWRRNQLVVVAVTLIGFTGSTLVMPFLALYIQQLGVTDTGDIALWTGLSLGSTPAISALCSPFWGRVADRYGNKLLVQRSLLSFVVVMGLMAYVTAPWQLFVLRALQGFFAGYGPLTLSMAALSAPREEMARAIGAVQTAQRIGPAIGPVVGGLIAAAVGQRDAFLVAAVVYAVALGLLTVLYSEPRQESRAGKTTGRVSFQDILALENFVLLTGLILAVQTIERSFGPVLPLYAHAIGAAGGRVELASGVLFSASAVCGALGHQLAAVLLKRWTARMVLAVSLLGSAIALIVFATVTPFWALIAAFGLFGLGAGTAMTAAFTAAGSVVPAHAHGASFGVLSSASLIGSSGGPVLGGLIAAQSVRGVFVAAAAALGIFALLVRSVMVERQPRVESPPAQEP
jgi:MFS transporter, DHA1 family, multidrug resistance protein